MAIVRAPLLLNEPSGQVIKGSLRFQKANGTSLTRTPGSAGNRSVYTGSVWIKRTQFAPDDTGNSNTHNHIIFSAGSNSGSNVDDFSFYKNAGGDDNKLRFQSYPGSTQYEVISDAKYRDPSGWYNVTWSYDGTTAKIYVNGERITELDTNTQNGGSSGHFNNTVQHVIGSTCDLQNSGEFDGYMSQFYWIDGQTLEPDSFGFTDPLTNTWKPKKYEGTFGTNGFYLPMDNQDDFEKDKSGNGNHFTKNNFSGTSIDPDVVKDSPSGAVFGGRAQTGITTTSSAPSNYAILNPLWVDLYDASLTNGNLDYSCDLSGNYPDRFSTIGVSSGKYYVEFTVGAIGNGTFYGVALDPRQNLNHLGATETSWGYLHNGNKYNNNSSSSYGASFTAGDTIGIALDMDARTLVFYKNGVSQGIAYSSLPSEPNDTYFFGISQTGTASTKANFGQKPYKYAPPQGFLPLSTASITPEKVFTRPERYVGIVTYKGDGSNNQIISVTPNLVNGTANPAAFNPDWIWIADRFTNGGAKWLFDSVRGSNSYLQTSSNNRDGVRTFTIDNNGVSIPAGDGSYNYNDSKSYFAMYLKAGGSSNTFNVDDVGYGSASDVGLDGGTITPNKASIGTKQGFSIIRFDSGSSGVKTLSHGLLEEPTFAIVKTLSSNSDWSVYHKDIGGVNSYLILNGIAGTATATEIWGSSLWTSSLFGIKSGTTCAASSSVVAYLWHDVPGLQKFGRFYGTRTNAQDYVFCGFKPAVVWLKRTDNTGKWAVFDTQKNKFNPAPRHNFLNETSDEQAAATGDSIDIVSNGFVVRSTNAYTDSNNTQQYIFCAWAEAPTSNLFGGQTNAR